MSEIKTNLKLKADESLLLYVNKNIAKAENTLQELYEKHADSDGFLYFTYYEMATMG